MCFTAFKRQMPFKWTSRMFSYVCERICGLPRLFIPFFLSVQLFFKRGIPFDIASSKSLKWELKMKEGKKLFTSVDEAQPIKPLRKSVLLWLIWFKGTRSTRSYLCEQIHIFCCVFELVFANVIFNQLFSVIRKNREISMKI